MNRVKLLTITIFLTVSTAVPAQNIEMNEIEELFREAYSFIGKDVDSAKLISNDIKVLSAELKDEWGFTQAKLIDALYYMEKNILDTAATFLLEVATDGERFAKNTFIEGRARLELGRVFHRLNNLDKAENNLMASSKIFLELDSMRYYSQSLGTLGINKGMRGEYPQALDYFTQQKEVLLSIAVQQERFRYDLSATFANIGYVYSLMRDHEKALEYAKRSLRIKLENELEEYNVAIGYIMLGTSFYEANIIDSAMYYNHLGVELAKSKVTKEPKYAEPIYLGLQNIATYHEQLGELEEAISILRSSLSYRTNGDQYWIEGYYTLLAEFYQKKDYPDSAKYFAAEALAIAESNKSKKSARDAAKKLADIHYQEKQYESAYRYQELYHTYNDSIYNESNERKFSNIRVELETSEKQQEIELLLKQREIDQAKANNLTIAIISIIGMSITVFILLLYLQKNRQKKQKIKQLEMQTAIEKKEVELQQQTLHMINLSNSMSDVEEKLREVKKKENVSRQDVQKVLSNIKVSKSMDKEWQQFESYFSNIHPKFNSLLVAQHTNLTQQERRLTALIKMDLSTREIAGLLSIEQRSVIMNRYRLKQKLGLNESEDLANYIQCLS